MPSKKYYAVNPDKYKAASKKWRENHPQYRKEYRKKHLEQEKKNKRKYYLLNKIKINKQRNQSYLMNKDKEKSQNREWQRNNKDKVIVKNKKWRKKNPIKVRVIEERRKARQKEAIGFFDSEDIEQLYIQQNKRCYYCNKMLKRKFHIDHKIPLSRDGSNRPENLCLACPNCNREKYTMTEEEFKKCKKYSLMALV